MLHGAHGHHGRALDEMRIEIGGVAAVDAVRVGNDPAYERRKRLDEGQEEKGVADVEHGVGVGYLMPDGRGRSLDEAYPERHERQPDAHAYDVEQHVGRAGLTRGASRAERREHRRDRGADVVAENDGNGRFQGNESLRAERDGQAHGGGTRLHKQREKHARGKAEQRIVAEGEENILPVAQESHGTFHGLHAYEEQAEAEQTFPEMLELSGRTDENEQHPHDDEQICQILDPEGQNLSRDRGADVGAHDDADGLGKIHETGVHEAHRHDGGRAAALNDHGDGRTQKNAQNGRFRKHAYDAAQSLAGHHLQGFADELDGVEKNSHAA